MDIEQLENSLKERVAPIYCFVSDQNFLLEMVMEAVKEAAPVGPMGDLNTDTFHAGEKQAIIQALETANQLPMMSKMRLVTIRECEQIKGKDGDALAEYLSNPSRYCCLVLSFSKLAKNTKLWKRSLKNGIAIQFEKIYERSMPFWIKRMAKREGKEITGAGTAFLTRAVGADLAKAHSEIEKAALYAGDKKAIDGPDIEAVLASVKAESIFDLTDALGGRDRTKALYLLKKMLDAGEQPLGILWQINSHLKRLMLVRALLADGAPPDQIGKALRVMDFVRDKLVSQAKLFSRRELRGAMMLTAKTDFDLKDGRISNRAILEKLFLELCTRTGSKNERLGLRPGL